MIFPRKILQVHDTSLLKENQLISFHKSILELFSLLWRIISDEKLLMYNTFINRFESTYLNQP